MLESPVKKVLTRTLSDTGKLKTDVVEFLEEWNTQKELECDLNVNEKECNVKRQVWMEAIDVLLGPVMSLCRRNGKSSNKWRSESNIRCRRQSQSVSEQQTYQLRQRRAMSESNLNSIKQVKCIAEFSPDRQKRRVCFSAPTSSACGRTFERRCCPNSRPRPILQHRNSIVAKPDYMDYSTFKAWRRGSRLSIDVCSIPLKPKECKEKKIEKILKNFISNCVNQMNHRSLPDM